MLPEEFEDELTCPVCLMLFTDPRTLPCGNSHNLCLECAKGLWRSQAPSFGFSITCPVCRVTCPIQNGVERLPLNLALKNMVEKLEAAQKGKPASKKAATKRRFRCDVCEKKPAVMECVTCVVKYCEACLETCHPKERAVFKAHVVAPMEPVSSRECEVHEGQALSFFCTQCGVMVCAHCLLMGSHIEHPRVSLHSAVMDKKNALQIAIDALTSKHHTVLDFTQRAEAAIQSMESSCRDMRGRVESECVELQVRVTQLQQKLMQVIDTQEREKRAVLMGQVEGQRQRLSVWTALLERAQQVMENEDGAVFLDVDTHKLDRQLRGAVDASLAPPVLATVAPGLTLNMGPVREAVTNMHFMEYLVPPPPSDLACVESSPTSLLITWNCDVKRDDRPSFIVQQMDFREGCKEDEWVEVYKGPGRSFSPTGLQEQSSYRFRVCAINNSGKGGWSAPKVFTTGVPRAPQDLTMLERTHRTLTVAWTGEPSVRSRHATYILEMMSPPLAGGYDQREEWREVYSGPSRVFTAPDLAPQQAYRFRVCAENNVGRGGYSPIKSFTTAQRMDGDVSIEHPDHAEEEGNDDSVCDDMAEQSMNAPSEMEGQGDENAVVEMAEHAEEQDGAPLLRGM